ncbi:MAG TPA: PDZ domain-containing protein [Gemmatimonas sp.]|nr:PDZ domain-containing protein [Gemmatimonas sp.]
MTTQQSSSRPVRRRAIRSSLAALLIGAVLGVGGLSAASDIATAQTPTRQTTPQPTRQPTRVTQRVPRDPSGRVLNPVCAELASMPTSLVHAPEGRALLKFKRDLEGAALALGGRGEMPERVEIRRIAEVNRNVDSLMQYVARRMLDADGKELPRDAARDLANGLAIVTVQGRDGARARTHVEPLRQMDPQQRERLTATIRSLEPQIARMTYEIAARSAVRVPMPKGWMGVSFSQSTLEVPSPSGMLTHYCEYPVVEVVHAGSPAARAGLLAGDTVVAYNKKDLRSAAVNMTTLLVPNRAVLVDYKRDGRNGQAALRITERPENAGTTFLRTTCARGEGCDGRVIAMTFDSLRTTRTPVAAGGAPGQGTRVIVRTSPSAGTMIASANASAGTGLAVLAGAQFAEIDDGFAAAMGVERGVLALSVPPGSAAGQSGLRSGEMILAVNGVPLRDVRVLRRAFETQGAREVRLTVTGRGTPARIVTVRW